jgi:hypothetical protein
MVEGIGHHIVDFASFYAGIFYESNTPLSPRILPSEMPNFLRRGVTHRDCYCAVSDEEMPDTEHKTAVLVTDLDRKQL